MQKLTILNSKEKKNIFSIMQKQWGTKIVPKQFDYVFMINEKGRVYISNKELFELDFSQLRVDSFGLYLGELLDKTFRLSIEGSQIIGPLAEKNVAELDDKQVRDWLRGEDIEAENVDGFVILKHGKDFAGSGKFVNGKIINFVPKIRRVRSSD